MAQKKATFPSFKDSNGDPTLPCLLPDGSISVTTGVTPGICLSATGEADPADTNQVVVTNIALSADETYCQIEVLASSNVDTVWEVCHVDDVGGTPVAESLMKFVTGPGNATSSFKLECLEFNTNGGTGSIQLQLKANNVSDDCLGCVYGTIAATQKV